MLAHLYPLGVCTAAAIHFALLFKAPKQLVASLFAVAAVGIALATFVSLVAGDGTVASKAWPFTLGLIVAHYTLHILTNPVKA